MNKKGDITLIHIFEILIVIFIAFLFFNLSNRVDSVDIQKAVLAKEIYFLVNSLFFTPGEAIIKLDNPQNLTVLLNNQKIIISKGKITELKRKETDLITPQTFQLSGSVNSPVFYLIKEGKRIYLSEKSEMPISTTPLLPLSLKEIVFSPITIPADKLFSLVSFQNKELSNSIKEGAVNFIVEPIKPEEKGVRIYFPEDSNLEKNQALASLIYQFLPLEEKEILSVERKYNRSEATVIFAFEEKHLFSLAQAISRALQQIKTISLPITTKPNIEVSYQYNLQQNSNPRTKEINLIILHHTGDSSAKTTIKTLLERGLSTHYIIDQDGTIYYVVDESRAAWHTAGYNSRSIGIDLVNTGHANMPYTEAQYQSLNKLIDDIVRRHPTIKKDNQHILGHFQFDPQKWDPSPNFDWAKIDLPDHEKPKLSMAAAKKYGYA